MAIINWEKTFGKWIKYNIWEIQHITKIFFLCIVLVSLFSRGLFLPLKRKINHNFLFPFNWIFIGFVGLLIDVVKAPGYLLGAVLSPFYHFEFFMIKKKTYTKDYLKKDNPDFKAGDTIGVNVKVVEGGRERIQRFEGVVLQKKGTGTNATFTVRKLSSGIGVERIFPLNSPNISSIEVVRRGKVRQAKIYYLRKLKGKAARIKEKR